MRVRPDGASTSYFDSERCIELSVDNVIRASLVRAGIAIDLDNCPTYTSGSFPLVAHHASGLYYWHDITRREGEWLPLDDAAFYSMQHLLWKGKRDD